MAQGQTHSPSQRLLRPRGRLRAEGAPFLWTWLRTERQGGHLARRAGPEEWRVGEVTRGHRHPASGFQFQWRPTELLRPPCRTQRVPSPSPPRGFQHAGHAGDMRQGPPSRAIASPPGAAGTTVPAPGLVQAAGEDAVGPGSHLPRVAADRSPRRPPDVPWPEGPLALLQATGIHPWRVVFRGPEDLGQFPPLSQPQAPVGSAEASVVTTCSRTSPSAPRGPQSAPTSPLCLEACLRGARPGRGQRGGGLPPRTVVPTRGLRKPRESGADTTGFPGGGGGGAATKSWPLWTRELPPSPFLVAAG